MSLYLANEVLSCKQSDHSIKSDDYNICCEFMVNLGKHFGVQPLNFESLQVSILPHGNKETADIRGQGPIKM